jgi:signal transduction histidine kinase
MMGIVRGILISILPPIFDMQDQQSFLARVTNSAVAVFYWNIIGSIILEHGSKFRSRVKEILNEILEKQLLGTSSATKESSNEITRIIGVLQEKIVAIVGGSPRREDIVKATNEIDLLIHEHIRPLSKARWQDGQLTWVRAGIFSVIRSCLESNRIPVITVIIFSIPFSIITQTSRIGLLGTLIVQSCWVFLTLSINWFVYRKKPKKNFTKQNLAFLIGVLLIAYPVTYFFQSILQIASPESLDSLVQGYIVSMITQVSLYIIATFVISLREDQDFAFDYLKQIINRGELANLVDKTRSNNSDAQFAQYLHAEVQSHLIACKLLLLKAAESNFDLFPPQVTQQILERMAKISEPYEPALMKTPAAQVRDLSTSWAGMAKISYELPAELENISEYSQIISQLITEGVVNSIRHGGANEISISATFTGKDLQVRIIDNGHLEGDTNSRGLGSILFNTFAKSWSLSRKDNQTVLLFVIDTNQKGVQL